MINKAIKLAIKKGKYRDTIHSNETGSQFENRVTLDPEFWQALGKALGWKYNNAKWVGEWLYHWHRFIDTRADGGDEEKFWKELLK